MSSEAISGVSITAPTVALIAGNNTANLSCQATAGTVTLRTWLKDNGPLSTSDRVVITDDMSTVMIKTVQKEDNGEYKCQLTNAVGSDSASYKMVVNCKRLTPSDWLILSLCSVFTCNYERIVVKMFNIKPK